MKIKLHKRLSEDTAYYERASFVKYADYLEEQGRIVRVKNLLFDARAMMLPFACDTRLCVPDAKGRIKGRKQESCSCCAVFTPRLSTDERNRVEEILPGLCARFPDLEERLDKEDGFYYWDEHYDRMVRKSGGDLCIFMCGDPGEFGFHACQIHAYCLEKGLAPELYKPSACVMFPFFIMDLDNEAGEVLVSCHSRELSRACDDEENYRKVGCLRSKEPQDAPPLYIALRNTLIHMFNREAWNALDAGLRQWCRAGARPEPPTVQE